MIKDSIDSILTYFFGKSKLKWNNKSVLFTHLKNLFSKHYHKLNKYKHISC